MAKYFWCALVGLSLGSIFAALNGCEKKPTGCDIEALVVKSATTAIGTAISCENPSALKPGIQKAIGVLNLCPQGHLAGILGKGLCSPAINAIFSAGLSSLPAEAKCTGGVPTDLAKATAIAACEALFP